MSQVPDFSATSKPPLTPEQRRRRKLLRGWIPSGIFVLLLLAVGVATLVFHIQGLGNPSRALPGFSRFSGKGMENISNTGVVRIDLRTLPLAAEPLGLPATSNRTVGPIYLDTVSLTLTGPHRSAKLPVDSVRIVTAHGLVTAIHTTTTTGTDFAALGVALDGDARLGITDTQVSRFLSVARGENREGRSYSRSVGTGSALGVPSTVSVACTAADGCVVSTETRLAQQ